MKLSIFLTIIVFVLLSCSNDCKSPTESQNHAPVIIEIIKDLSEVPTNRWVTLTAIATDKDGDSLTYYWNASAGRIDAYETTENPTRWESPSEPGEYTVTCTVSDGKETNSKSISITVI